ncbi:type IV secretory system conjugative DNA transfer family protein [uncultured Dokdonia sp.]|uniref:type IV secretory system conjugative DNA transfer family protein n=1 Tax=uncultured Dokdonia sp. TaxID=575653 RepID=UPI0026074B7E|nr:type IV secretory system conjugative DNA transfer family protein [uncultured Dokdonia sp.]
MNFFELIVDALEDLLAFLDPNKHRLKGKFMPSYKVLKRRYKGFNVNGKSITPKLSMQGLLVNGETGSYKTSGVIIRSILTVTGSQLIHDPSKELFEKTSGALAEKGVNIFQLDFTNPSGSLRFSPMLRANTKSQITQLATNLVTINGDDKGEDASFWNQKAIETLYVLISILKTQDVKYQNLSNVAYLLDMMQAGHTTALVDAFFDAYGSEELFVKYSSIKSQSPNTLSSVLGTAQTAVQLFTLDENIAAITATDNIGDFIDLRKSPSVIYIHSSIAKMHYYSKISSIFLSQFFERFFEELPQKEMLDMYFHLDELPVLSINSLDVICANIRKYRGAIMAVTQDAKAQLTARYGYRAQAILSNLRTKIYLSANLNTAMELERTLGRYDFNDKQDGDRLKSRSVLAADEIMALPSNKALVFVSGMRMMKVRVTPYFKIKKLRKLSELPPFVSDVNISSDTIALISLENLLPNTDTDESAD